MVKSCTTYTMRWDWQLPSPHAKTQYRKFETNIPRKGIARPQSQFPRTCVFERFIHCHDQSSYSAAGIYVDRSWEYINRSQIHECGNWDWGCAIPYMGIHRWDFRCSVGGQTARFRSLPPFSLETPNYPPPNCGQVSDVRHNSPHGYMNVEVGTEAAQFFIWEHINGILLQCMRLQQGRQFPLSPSLLSG